VDLARTVSQSINFEMLLPNVSREFNAAKNNSRMNEAVEPHYRLIPVSSVRLW
jgi:hypothetical protein